MGRGGAPNECSLGVWADSRMHDSGAAALHHSTGAFLSDLVLLRRKTCGPKEGEPILAAEHSPSPSVHREVSVM